MGEVVYHSSPNEFKEFHPLSHFGSIKAARVRANSIKAVAPHRVKDRGYNLYAAELDHRRMIDIPHNIDSEPEHIIRALYDNKHIDGNTHDEWFEKIMTIGDGGERKKFLAASMKAKGIDTIRYPAIEDKNSHSYIITSPDQVRLRAHRKGIKNINPLPIAETYRGLRSFRQWLLL